MRLKLISVGMAFVVSATLCQAVTASDLTVDIKSSKYSKEDAADIVAMFRRNCRPLGNEFWADVGEVNVSISDEYAEHRLARGWTTNIHLSIKYSDNPNTGPAYAAGTGVLAGHTLHYDLGGGSSPGYLATKRSSQYLCGLSISDDGSDVFEPVPEFSALDR